MTAACCPVHDKPTECDYSCYAARAELRQVGAGLRSYWFDRKNGMPSMHLAEYRARFGVTSMLTVGSLGRQWAT